MKILSLSNDNKILDPNSAVARRTSLFGQLVDAYTVLVPNKKNNDIHICENVSAQGSGGGFSKVCQLFRLYSEAHKILKKARYDVVTSQDPYYLGLLAYILAKKFRLGLEVQFHGLEKMSGLRRMIARFVLTRANVVRTVSCRFRNILLSEFFVNETKITVVPIYVEPCGQVEGMQKNDNDFILLTACRLVKVKRVEWQIEAMNRLRDLPIKLWIAGDGPEKERLEKLCKSNNLRDKVRFLGWQAKNDLCRLYQDSNAYILTSESEGWGLAAIEAAYHNLPVIMTDVGCAGEIFINNESALIVNSVEELVQSIKRIFQEGELRQSLVSGALGRLKTLPDQQQTLELYLQSWTKAKL